MTTGLDYIGSLAAYVINLDRSTDRWAAFLERTAPLLGQVKRVPGTDGRGCDKTEVLTFAAQAAGVSRAAPELRIAPKKSFKYWQGTYGIYCSHLRALAQAVHDRQPRFLILEDDARVRPELAAVTPIPQGQGAFVWGGALLSGSYTTHARRARLNPHSNPWKRIPPMPTKVRNRYQATAVELDLESAVRWLDTVKRHPQAYDSAWWFAMMQVPTFVPTVEVIYQDLRIGSTHSASAGYARQRNAARLEAEQ